GSASRLQGCSGRRRPAPGGAGRWPLTAGETAAAGRDRHPSAPPDRHPRGGHGVFSAPRRAIVHGAKVVSVRREAPARTVAEAVAAGRMRGEGRGAAPGGGPKEADRGGELLHRFWREVWPEF